MKLQASPLLAFALLEYGSAAVVEREAKGAVNASSYDFVCCLARRTVSIPTPKMI